MPNPRRPEHRPGQLPSPPPRKPVGPTPVDPKGPTPKDPKGPIPVDPKGPIPVDPKGPIPKDPKGPIPVDPKGPRLPTVTITLEQADVPVLVPSWQPTSGVPEFERLDDGVPLLLLPVRLETIYDLDADPPELRIRIYPDQLHVAADRGVPTTGEVEAAKDFRRARSAASTDDGRTEAWRALVDAVGAGRAGWLARLLQPLGSTTTKSALVFPSVATDDTVAQSHLALLPNRWVAVGYHGTTHLFTAESRAVDHDIVTSLDPADPGWVVTDAGIQVSPGMQWMIDYERAVEQGMAITVPLANQDATTTITTLVVVGVDSTLDADEAAAALADLLGSHQRSTGFAFVAPGTATNNTDDDAAGWARTEDVDALGERELAELRARPASNAARLAKALGLDDELLVHSEAATSTDHLDAQAMRRVLFEPVIGTMLRDMLAVDGVTWPLRAELEDLRAWMVEHVEPAGPLPTVRVGRMPYGVLPVSLLGDGTAGGTSGEVERFVTYLRDEWRRSFENVPALDPGRIDSLGAGDPAQLLPSVLASAPDPARVFSRRFYDDDSDFWGFLSPQGWYEGIELVIPILQPKLQALLDVVKPSHFDDLADQMSFWAGMYAVLDEAVADAAADSRVENWTAEEVDLATSTIDSMLVLVEAIEGRQRPLRDLDIPGFAGVLGEELTAVVGGRFVAETHEWTGTRLVEDATIDGGTAADYLRDLAARVGGAASSLPEAFLDAPPLLYQLVNTTFTELTEQSGASSSLERLANLDVETLERLFRQTLGLASHRLDAWATSVVANRLDDLREERATGLNLGAFGWVIDLEPGTTRASNGFLHAPSLAQATTAAILRSSWQAHGDFSTGSPAAVDASSARVRTTEWIVDGVRNGQSLGELLGYRFERMLSEGGLAGQIRDIRAVVVGATPDGDASVDEPVDGEDLLAAYHDGDLAAYLSGLGTGRAAVEEVLEAVEAGFDAVADVLLFESTHALVNGNLERASALFETMSYGTNAPPELRAARTGRDAASVEHRLVLLFDAAASASDGGGWTSGLRDRLAAPLEAWLRERLPNPSEVGLTVTTGDATSELTLDTLGLSALDALALVSPDATATTASFRALVTGVHGLDPTSSIDAASAGAAAVSLEEFQVVAGQLRSLVDRARVADGRDLRPATAAGDAGLGVDGIAATLATLVDELTAAGDEPDPVALARFGLGGIDTADLAARIDVRVVAPTGDEDIATLAGQAATLFGAATPVLPSFTWVSGDDVTPAVSLDSALATAGELTEWLDAVGRVRPAAGRLATSALLGALLGVDALTLAAGQDRTEAGEGWAAISAPPPGTGGRLSVAAVLDGGRPPTPGGAVCGLLLDQWSERLPAADAVTGVAVHFDRPSTAAPQAWLLAVPPEGRSWSCELVVEILHETLEWAQLRAVQPEDLGDYGQAIPTAWAGSTLTALPAAAT
jgi:hypothetical protein